MPAHKRDYYDILGVQPTADEAEIKRAFRALALKLHPDKNPGDREAEDAFKEANEAYAVLCDDDKRAAYDRFGHSAFVRGAGGGPPAGFDSVADVVEGFLGDLLGKRRRREAGRDLRYTLEVKFEEAAFGVEKTIRFPTRKDCEVCRGSGGRRGSAASTRACATCGGRGEVRERQGFFQIPRTCASCQGTGKVVVDPCPTCQGSGLVRIERELAVKLPPGTEDGAVRRVAGEGEPGRRGGTPGDLQVMVRVLPHPLFERKGHDVTTEVPVSISQAALGAHVSIPTLDGRVLMRVPEGTQSGRVFRLRGKGIPRGEGKGRGDQHVRIVVETPTKLSPKQRELLEELARASGEPRGEALAQPRRRNFLDKVRELFGVES